MNGHATRIVVTLARRRQDDLGRRQRPRHPGRRPSQDRQERARGDLHHAARRRQVRQRRLQGRRRPARRRRQRRQRPEQEPDRRGPPRRQTYTQRYRRGKPLGPVEQGEPSRGTGHDRHLHARPRDLPRRRLRPRADRRAARGQDLPQQGAGHPVRRSEEQDERRVPPRRRRGRLPRRGQPGARTTSGSPPCRSCSSARTSDEGLRCHLALAWTEATDEDVRSFVNTIPTRDGGTHELGMLRGRRHGRPAVHGRRTTWSRRGWRSSARTSAKG